MIAAGACAECTDDLHCADDSACIRNQCVPGATLGRCVNSFDCPTGSVCNTRIYRGRCVECLTNAECSTGQRCVEENCVPTCDSDLDCIALGLLCSNGVCSQCARDADCPGVYHCEGGRCEIDMCEAAVDTGCRGSLYPSESYWRTRCSGRGTEYAHAGNCPSACAMFPYEGFCCDEGTTVCSADRTMVTRCAPLSLPTPQACPAGESCSDGVCTPP